MKKRLINKYKAAEDAIAKSLSRVNMVATPNSPEAKALIHGMATSRDRTSKLLSSPTQHYLDSRPMSRSREKGINNHIDEQFKEKFFGKRISTATKTTRSKLLVVVTSLCRFSVTSKQETVKLSTHNS